jgi:anion-transporting  ArsA/GET3 family ATPase
MGEPSGGYSHGEGRFLHGNYDRDVSGRSRRSPGRSGVLRERLAGKRVCVCLGAGGVGKTTTSAAVALGLAEGGSKVAVVTIDPAARLADALGLEQLCAEPRPVDADTLAAHGLELAGELWAMRLDAKGTFDEIIARFTPDPQAREEILANPIYRELSSAVAGSQELSAMAKLYELRHEADFDVIVLDTPPSRNAVDFLEAPTRLLGFLEGRALKVFLAPGGLAARVFGASTGLAFAIFARVTGVELLGDLSRFFRSLSGVIDAFSERTRGVASLLRDASTGFLIVTSPEHEPAQEAEFLAHRLAATGMSRTGLIVNRVHFDGLAADSAAQVRALLAPAVGDELAGRAASNLADFDVLVRRDAAAVAQLSARLQEPDPLLVPELDAEIGDLAGLARVARHLFGAAPLS